MILLSLVIMVLAFLGDQGLIHSYFLENEIHHIKNNMERLKTQNIQFQFQAYEYQNNPFMVEKIAREELDLVRSEEIVFRVKTN